MFWFVVYDINNDDVDKEYGCGGNGDGE